MKYFGVLGLLLLASSSVAALTVQDVLDQVGIAKAQVYDQAGQVRDDVIDSWSESQLREWLELHQVKASQAADDASEDAQAALESLRASVLSHKDLLVADIQTYQDAASSKADAFLSKSTDYIADTYNSLFETTVQTWSDAKLQAYLAARGVATQAATSRDQLLELVQTNKDKVANSKLIGTWSFDSWSYSDLKAKLSELGDKTTGGTRAELEARLADAYAHSTGAATSTWDKLKEAVSFESWSTPDLSEYLESFGVAASESREKLQAEAQRQYNFFTRGTREPETIWEKAQAHGTHYGNLAWFHITEHFSLQYARFKAFAGYLYDRYFKYNSKLDL